MGPSVINFDTPRRLSTLYQHFKRKRIGRARFGRRPILPISLRAGILYEMKVATLNPIHKSRGNASSL